MNILKCLSIGFLATFVIGINPADAKSKFNFSLNVGPSYPYPVYATPYPVYQAPVYQPYYAPPSYPVYREYYSRPVYERTVCSYDYWGNPYNCYVERY